MTGIGDLEVQPAKWSFLRRRELVMTTALGVLVPTEDVGRDLRGGLWVVEPHLFVDAEAGTFALQSNLVYGFVEGGEQEVELSASVARMFFFDGFDAVGPIVELMGGLVSRGEEAGEWEELGLAPGVKLQLGSWHFGGGIRLPLVDRHASDRLLVLTGGYHVSF